MSKFVLVVFIIVCLLLLLFLLFGWLWFYIFRGKYTRERFAFSLLFRYSCAIALFLDYVLSTN